MHAGVARSKQVSKPIAVGGQAVLTIGHMAGMIDMVALPLWIGSLMQHYAFSPQFAGITVTLFLLGMLVASGIMAPLFNRLPRRLITAAGFALSAASFIAITRQPMAADSFTVLAPLHALAGFFTGCALSMTHGCIGRTDNPHRQFGYANTAVGVMGVALFATLPGLTSRGGGTLVFLVFALAMGLAALAAAIAFPDPGKGPAAERAGARDGRMPRMIWVLIAVVMCLTLNQAMVFAFVERIGAERGFGADRVQSALVVLGLVNLLPGLLAALLQKRIAPATVGLLGPIGQAVLAMVLSHSTVFAAYAVATALYVSMVIFTHIFLFGLMTRLDPSGRAVTATPAMMMFGSCLGPTLGGFIVAGLGYRGLGWMACVVSAVAVLLMWQVRRRLRRPEPQLAGAPA